MHMQLCVPPILAFIVQNYSTLSHADPNRCLIPLALFSRADRRDLPDGHPGSVAAAVGQLLHLCDRLRLSGLQWRME